MKMTEQDKKIKRLKIRLIQLKVRLLRLLLRKKVTEPSIDGPEYIVIHHGAGEMGFEGVNSYHEAKWGFKSSLGYYAGYHYFIENDGSVHQARRDTERAAHTVEKGNPGYWNNNSIGICLQGHLGTRRPLDMQVEALDELLEDKLSKYGLDRSKVKMHCEIAPTLCPGKYLKEIIKEYRGDES